jgi:hypothetical protein
MQSPSVVSNGTKIREDETEVLEGYREVALRPLSTWEQYSDSARGRGVGMPRNHLDV